MTVSEIISTVNLVLKGPPDLSLNEDLCGISNSFLCVRVMGQLNETKSSVLGSLGWPFITYIIIICYKFIFENVQNIQISTFMWFLTFI